LQGKNYTGTAVAEFSLAVVGAVLLCIVLYSSTKDTN